MRLSVRNKLNISNPMSKPAKMFEMFTKKKNKTKAQLFFRILHIKLSIEKQALTRITSTSYEGG